MKSSQLQSMSVAVSTIFHSEAALITIEQSFAVGSVFGCALSTFLSPCRRDVVNLCIGVHINCKLCATKRYTVWTVCAEMQLPPAPEICNSKCINNHKVHK